MRNSSARLEVVEELSTRRNFLWQAAVTTVLAGVSTLGFRIKPAEAFAENPSPDELDELHRELLYQTVVEETLRAGLIVAASWSPSFGYEVIQVGDVYAEKEKGLGLIYAVRINNGPIEIPQGGGASAYENVVSPWDTVTIIWARKGVTPIPPYTIITLNQNSRRIR